jgi:hypothetical protein
LKTGTVSRKSESLDHTLVIHFSQKYPVIFFLPKVSALIKPSSHLPIQTSIRSKLCHLSHERTIAPPLSAISPTPNHGKYIKDQNGYDDGHASIPLKTFLPDAQLCHSPLRITSSTKFGL